GVIWNINSFDQWGVQLGKRIAGEISERIDTNAADFDTSTQGLLELVRAHFANGGSSEKESASGSADKKPSRKKR
ncbi:MAG: glucose-6-phosphate isomerase, partial [Halomonas sp.]|nr:glucose-6-phosphate isomerase [Halomonas sp.]